MPSPEGNTAEGAPSASARWQRVDELFARALELDGDARNRFLADACADDHALRGELESLLAHARAGDTGLRGRIAAAAGELADELVRTAVGRRLGPYRITDVIGEGGMGVVYRATRDDAEYRRDVAIKVLRAGPVTPAAIARLRDERQVLAALDHPGIVRLLDGGRTDDGLPYLVMEHIDGAPLAEHARTLDVRARVELVIRVGEAVQYAHQHLVVHRDLKPSNVLVDRTGAPRLLDFGIAKLLDPAAAREAATRTGMGAFTVEYASPEQVRGDPVTVATDVYSLGALLYDVLVGAPPQRAGETMRETLANICDRPPPRPSLAAAGPHARELAGDLDNIALKALQKRPADRYPSVAALVDDLRRHLAGLPVSAREATFRYRAGKAIVRHRATLALALVVLATLTIATVMSLVQARRADRNAARAERERLTLLVERGRQELASERGGRALPFLAEALRSGADTAAVRFLIGSAMRPYAARVATIDPPAGVTDAVWSPDGRTIALTTTRGEARLFDREGRQLAAFAIGTGRADVYFSADGAVVITHDTAGHVTIADGHTGAARVSFDASPTAQWVSLALVDGGRRLLTGARDGRLTAWDTATGAPIASTDVGCRIIHVVVGKDDRTAAVKCHEAAVALVDVRSLAVVARAPADPFSDVAGFSADGARLYTSYHSTDVWGTATGERVATMPGAVKAIGPDGLVLLSDDDGVGRIVDPATGVVLRQLVGHERGGWGVAAWSHDGRSIVTTGMDGTIRSWAADTAERLSLVETPPGTRATDVQSGGAFLARFSPDDSRLLTVSGRGATVWAVDRGALRAEVAAGATMYCATWSPDERGIAMAGRGTLTLVDTRGATTTVPIGDGTLYDVNWSPDGARLIVVGDAGVARVLDRDGHLLFDLAGHGERVNRGSFSPDGALLVTASSDRTARIWDAARGGVQRVLRHPGMVLAAAWNRDGTRLATASFDHHLRIWDVRSGLLLTDLDGGAAEYLDVTFSPDGRSLGAAARGGEAEVWDVATGRRRLVLEGQVLWVTTIVWSPDGALIATSAGDHVLRIWDATTGALLARFDHPSDVMSAQWSRRGDRLLTASANGVARIWDAARFTGTVDELDRFLAERVPYRLVAGRLEHVQ